MNTKILDAFGNIDIYLFDQLMKGTFNKCETVIDIGCGSGRNMIYFLKNNFRVYGIDQDERAVDAVRSVAKKIAPLNRPDNFVVGTADDIPFPNTFFDLAICSAVLHFANDEAHFDRMIHSIWRILKPGGFLFARLASDIGIERLVVSAGNRKYLLPDGSVRFLVNEDILLRYTQELKGTFYEPIKTTNVGNTRCMTTWCIQKM